MYIYSASQALYPSIYLNLKERSDKERSFRYVQAIVAEAQRIAHKRKPRLPVYAYTKIEYDPRNYNCSFYDPQDLCTTIVLPYRMGVDGIILWSSSNGMTYRCKILTNFLEEKLGPFLKDVVDGKYGERDSDYNDKKMWDYDEVCGPYISNITHYGSSFFICNDDTTTTARPGP
ncbi:Hyaluronidase [Trichostrongylus colubriformis]|uniref:Hyaluronidase n=1 Tax=Trichostrongylus colubriformis TaxID=6319 RepID=A0AAN8ERP9_TRICO